ncbi:hypothetical protein [Haloprofundus salilacus]|uniref:hypothetical protein n=1 Tax=Haloprofundus salilacus TaxID=2876190 RepID=UPI001CCD7ADF|nr:hypothetical protein [Haloprofundus salilacus]
MYQQTSDQPTLPTLQKGATLLQANQRATGALHSLVVDHLLLEGGDAVWVDARGNGTTQQLCRIAPTMRVLDRVHIARGFTPWQHYSLLTDLSDQIAEDTPLVVLPEFDWFYRTDDLRRSEGERLFSEAVSRVTELLDGVDVPVLLTLSESDDFTEPLDDMVSETVECELTKYGPRFSGDSFETLVYPLDNGLVQTTISYWNHILAARHPAVIPATTSPEVTTVGAN